MFSRMLIFSLLFASLSPAADKPIFPAMETAVLDNGLKLVSIPMNTPGVISFWTVVRTGSRNEVEEGKSGFAHFFEHMMFRGTPKYPPEKYNNILQKLGADENAFTSDDLTAYFITAASSGLDTIMELESDRFKNLEYDEAGYRKEALAVYGEYKKNSTSPGSVLSEVIRDKAFQRHTYKHTTIGFERDIIAMPDNYAYSREFFKRWYRPENATVIVAGDIKHAHLVQLGKRHYGDWAKGVAQIQIPSEPEQKREKRFAVKWQNGSLPILQLGYKVSGFDPQDTDNVSLDVISEALFGPTSALYKKLVLEDKKVISLQGGYVPHRDAYLFTITARLNDAADFDLVETEIRKSIETAKQHELEEQRLSEIQSRLRYEFAMDLKTPYDVGQQAVYYVALTGRPDAANDYYATLAALSPKRVSHALNRFFKNEGLTVLRLTGGAAATVVEEIGDLPAVVAPTTAKTQTGRRRGAEVSPQRIVLTGATVQSQAETSQQKDSPIVAIRVLFALGSQNDPPGKEGLAELAATLMRQGGTKALTYSELLDRLYPMAASIGGNVDKEMTVFTAEVHQDKLDDFLPLFLDVIASPRLGEDDFDRVKNNQLDTLKVVLRNNNDEELGKQVLQWNLYSAGRHPYQHVELGRVSSVETITLEDVQKFVRERITRGAMSVRAAGGSQPDLQEKIAAELAGRLPSSDANRPRLPAIAAPQKMELTIVQKPQAIASAISLGFPLTINRSDDDYYALRVAESAFGEHRCMIGRLMRHMREERGLNYGDYAYIESFIQEGFVTRFAMPNIARRQQYFSIWIRPVSHDNVGFSIRQAIWELNRLMKDGLSPQEFSDARDFLRNYSKLWVQTDLRRLGYELDGAFYGKKSVVDELEERLTKMTVQDVNAAIKRHLQAKNLSVAVITGGTLADGKPRAEGLKELLLSGAKTPLVTNSPMPSALVEENKVIEVYPLDMNTERFKIVPVDQLFN